MGSRKEKALKIIQQASRISVREPRHNPGAVTRSGIVQKGHNRAGQGMKELQTAAKPPLGWVWGDFYSPWQAKFPPDPSFNKNAHMMREYPPISLIELQRLIDLGWITADNKLIDLTTFCNTYQYKCDPTLRQFGVQLTDEGVDAFAARVNIEVQYASELAIAAIEKNGGTLFTAYYDQRALDALVNPKRHFEHGRPVPRRLAPPSDLIEYYSSAKSRGYLAPLDEIRHARFELSQKYGYRYTELDEEHMKWRKRCDQVFYGLEAGDVVSLVDRCVLRPVDEEVKKYYAAEKE